MEPAVPTFEEWFARISTFQSHHERWDFTDDLYEPLAVTEYLHRLLTEAPRLCAGIPPTQLGLLIWHFQGSNSGYWWEVRKPEVPKEAQVATVLALRDFYCDFLDPYFLGLPGDADSSAAEAVYMMWDMDALEGAAMFPGEEHLVDPIFEVLHAALMCKSDACQKSALHGLGHQKMYHPQRVEREIDRALEMRHIWPHLVEYAQQARTGLIL